MKQVILAAGVVAAITASSCSSHKYTPANPNTPTQAVGYDTHIKPIINNFCITCHGGASPSGDLPLNTYGDVLKAAKDGPLLKRINDAAHPMPVGGLMPKNERVMFNKWKANNFMEHGKIDSNLSMNEYNWTPKPVEAVDINTTPVELLTQMQGHWVGDMVLMGQKIPWFAWDFRPIAPSHVHAIFEGGSMGNLFNSLFVADFKGTQTIMARNGGILNGIYRTSYFVLDKAEVTDKESYYRLVDAYGNDEIMWMEFRFTENEMVFNSYTSRFGTYPTPKKHMAFKGQLAHNDLSTEAAQQVGFPATQTAYNFEKGLPTPIWKEYGSPTSASYLWTDVSLDLTTLGELSKDPIPIGKMPYVASMKLSWNSDSLVHQYPTQIYLSRQPLTDPNSTMEKAYGYISLDKMNEVVLFSEINKNTTEFTFHYLHPGTYYLTRWVDVDKDYSLSPGDVFQPSIPVTLTPKEIKELVLPTTPFLTV